MIVTGCPPPYKHVPRTLREPSTCSLLNPYVSRKHTSTSSTERIVERKRPKSTPLRISEKILEKFNEEQTGSRLTFVGSKCRRNLKAMERTFSNKGLYFKIVQPGYMMTKRKSGISVTLNIEELLANGAKGKRKSSIQDERDTLIKTLQLEINNLNATLVEERISYSSQLKQFVENTKIDVEVMQHEHREHIKSIEEDHREEIEKITETYEAKLKAGRDEANSEAARMQGEMNSMRETLELCKEEVAAEMENKWLKEKEQLESDFELKIDELLAQERLKLKTLRNEELNSVNQDHVMKTEKLVEEHQKEMNTLLEKFALCAADAENLKIALFEAEKLKEEVEELREVCARTKEQLRRTQNELADAKVKLQGYELSFSEKVAEVEDRYSMKMHELMLNNADIRRNYMKKCAELLDAQTKNYPAQTIIVARTKADLSLVTDDQTHSSVNQTDGHKLPRTSRPQSAPTAKRDFVKPEDAKSSDGDRQVKDGRPNSGLA